MAILGTVKVVFDNAKLVRGLRRIRARIRKFKKTEYRRPKLADQLEA